VNDAPPATAPGLRVGRYRPHAPTGRSRQVRLRYTDDEYATIARAAQSAGLTPTGYVAEAALAAANSQEPPRDAPWRTALIELMAARTQVRRIGVNINQAARALNANGEASVWLEHALAMTDRSMTRVDDAAAAVAVLADTSLVKRNQRRHSCRPASALLGLEARRPDEWEQPGTG